MAADAAKSSGSTDSYIGSFISLTSKSQIRYEGFLFHLNPQESIIGLRNVKSFGTEGRREDGLQILPSDKVFEHIFFRGSDIKDLQVISSPPVEIMPSVPSDPAIIQSHYPHSTATSTSLLSAGVMSATNLNSNTNSGLPTTSIVGNAPLYQSVGNSGSWGSSRPPPTANANGLAMPTCWPEFTGSSAGISHLQQQSLLQLPQGLRVSSPELRQMQYPSLNASIAASTSNFDEFSHSLLPNVSTGCPNLTSYVSPPSALPVNLPIGQSATLASNLSPNLMPNNVPNALPSVTLGFSSPLVSSLATSSLNVNAVVPPIADEPKSILGSTMPYQTMSQSMPSIVGTSNASHSEASIPSLVTPAQLLQPGLAISSSSHSLQTAHKGIEAAQASTSEPLSSDLKNTQEPAQQLPSVSTKKLNGAGLHTHQSNRWLAQGRGNGNGTALHSHCPNRGHAWGRGNGLDGAALHTHHSYRSHEVGRGNRLSGAAVNPHHSNRGRSWGREYGPNGAILHTRTYNGGHGQGRGTKVSPTVTKFTEDFDFEAMNEKFNKEEVWGLLSKSNKAGLEDKGGHENESDAQDEVIDGLSTVDTKPVYIKDEFFDSLSGSQFDRDSGRGKMKVSEQMRIDTETFGEFQRNRCGCGSQGPHWAGRPQGSYHGIGRGYGRAGRGRGRAFWSHVT